MISKQSVLEAIDEEIKRHNEWGEVVSLCAAIEANSIRLIVKNMPTDEDIEKILYDKSKESIKGKTMGCDIHISSELKIDGVWYHFNEITDVGRWYQLFGKMANVRNIYEEPISNPKGLPIDCCPLTKVLYNDTSRYHSHSWLDRYEIDQLMKWHENLNEECFWLDGLLIEAAMYIQNDQIQDYRIVFCFDS